MTHIFKRRKMIVNVIKNKENFLLWIEIDKKWYDWSKILTF